MGARHSTCVTLMALAAAMAVGLFASPGAAADRVYFGSGGISYANLDGTGGGELDTPGASSGAPYGMAIDPAAGKIYWASGSGAQSRISVANLDGGGGMDLPISGAPLNWPRGVALDLGAGRIYWANYQETATERIGYANLDGSGGGFLNTSGATASNPTGVAIDSIAGRIYWSNETGKISYASLDGSGGADINTTGATTGVTASGVAVDRATSRIYWVSNKGFIPYSAYLSYASLDGSGGADVPTTVADGAFPWGVAVDSEMGRVYWANTTAGLGTASISFVAFGGGSSQDLNLDGAPSQAAKFPTLLKAPVGTGAPKLTAGISARPRFLICDQGSWASDMPEAQLYQAPHSFSYRWLRDGRPVPGATDSDIGVEGPGGDYACQVTATNAAGSTTQTSRTQFVCCRPSPKAKAARVALVKGGKARLKLTCPAGTEPCAGRIHLESIRPPRRRAHSSAGKGPKLPNLPANYGERSISIPAGEKQVVNVRLSRGAKSRLRKSRRHQVRAGLDGSAVESRTVLLKLAKKKPKRR
jgi:hypothetical protein